MTLEQPAVDAPHAPHAPRALRASRAREREERIVAAALELLDEGGAAAVTTRAVAAAAGVQPMAIYRVHGDMDHLLEAAVTQGFASYLAAKTSRVPAADPVDDLRAGWDLHVGFGLEHPHLYALMYGRPDVHPAAPAAEQVSAVLVGLVERVARAGRLRTDVASAATTIHAAGCGVTLTLIAEQPDGRDPHLSHRVREAVLASVTTDAVVDASVADTSAGTAPADGGTARAACAAALAARLDDGPDVLTAGERVLLGELLARVARSDG